MLVVLAGAGAAAPLPAAHPDRAEARTPNCASVLIIYVDGLRRDVLDDMVTSGALPNIAEVFYRGGTRFDQAFTVFPSSTVPANAVMWTGLYADRTGIRDQVSLVRRPGARPRQIDRLTKFAPEQTHDAIENAGVRSLFTLLHPGAFSTILPISDFSPPHLWLNEAANASNSFFSASVSLKRNIDDANLDHALTFIHNPQARLMVLWLPLLDETGHRTLRGQFGPGREVLRHVDEIVGRVRDDLRQEQRWDNTTLILCSDHGHLGGEPLAETGNSPHAGLGTLPGGIRYNQIWDAPGFFLRHGFNVEHVHRHWTLPGVRRARLVYLGDGGGGTGYLGVYLPYKNGDSGDWSQPNSPRELLAYRLDPSLPPVDLLETLVTQKAESQLTGQNSQPIDFALARVSEDSILIHKSRECQALVTLRRGDTARAGEVRYRPIRHFRFDSATQAYTYDANPASDPLGYLADRAFRDARGFLGDWHSEAEWLAATAATRYPGAPFLMAHHLLSGPGLNKAARATVPDLVLVPNPGWSFIAHDLDDPAPPEFQGTTHGYPDRECLRVPLFFRGPGIRKDAALAAPHTLVDLAPTILWLLGQTRELSKLDGAPMTEILEDAAR